MISKTLAKSNKVVSVNNGGGGTQNIQMSHLSKKKGDLRSKLGPSELSNKKNRIKFSNLKTINGHENDDVSLKDKLSQVVGGAGNRYDNREYLDYTLPKGGASLK